jgi:hypothetical protein
MESKQPYAGVFLPRDFSHAGHLTIADVDSLLTLVSKQVWNSSPEEFRDIHGTLADGRKASLLECIRAGQTDHRWGEAAQSEINFFPHYVVVGEEFINSSDAAIQAVHYHFENVDCLVHAYGTFRDLHTTRDEALRILEADHRRSEEIATKHGWSTHPFNPQIDEHPFLLYYSGLQQITKFDTNLGTLSFHNRTMHGPGGPKGIGIENQITVSLEFSTLKTVREVTSALVTLHSLFELSLSRRQRYEWIELELEKPEQDNNSPIPRNLELYWSYCNERVTGKTKTTHIGDVLISPDMRPEEFASVTSGWINSDPAMHDARARFGTAFHSQSYGVDRIIGAANMFDLLPADRAPKKKQSDSDTIAAVEKCQEIFKDLPNSFARQSVLSALGRVGTASLRDKVLHRAQIVVDASNHDFPDIHIPCSQAVLCRNHYVHGSPPSFDYHQEFRAFAFLTDTLEFVFAASDLIELGWDFNEWMKSGSVGSHDFGIYVAGYTQNLDRLKNIPRTGTSETSKRGPVQQSSARLNDD